MSIMCEVIWTALTAWGNFFVSIGDFLDSHEGVFTVIAAAITAIATGFIGWFTCVLAKSTNRLSALASRQEKMTKTIERAYVKMSHTDQGLLFGNNSTIRWATVEVKIENCGPTPARVTDVRLNLMVERDPEPEFKWPTDPEYGPEFQDGPINGFLVTEDFFFVRERTFKLGNRTLADPRTSALLCLVGYVDYIDAFGQRHRSGYAREYRHIIGNNLVFVTQKDYNYDRQRNPTEGNDWDEPT